MKKLAISTLAVLIACPAFAGQHCNDSFWSDLDPYIALRGGIGYTNTNYNFDGQKESIADMVLDGRVALGIQMHKLYRTELEWAIYGDAKDNADFGAATDVEVKTKLQTLLLNTYMDLGSYNIVRPYIGLGAGVGFTEIGRSGATIEPHTDDKGGFAAGAILGMTFDMDQFAIDVATRYTYVDVQAGLHNFGADIGVRFMF